MPLRKDPLLEALSEKRDQLKQRYKQADGRMPVICSDEALIEMSKRQPLQKSDFEAIQGLGKVFVDLYAEDFLRVILLHKNTLIQEVEVSKKTKYLLADYHDRLTNISRRNRNLYSGKLSQRLGIDLSQYHSQEKLKKFMLFQSNKLERLTNRKDSSEASEKYYRQLTLLYREIQRDLKETGSYNVYLAYPYVQGRFPKDGFEIKAPLMFFPVVLIRKGMDFYLKFDQDRDVLLNRDLLLAHHKFNGVSDIKEMPRSEDLSAHTIDSVILPFLAKNHLDVINASSPYQFEAYENTTKADFKKVKKGHLEIKNYLVLGKFNIYSSKIQEDLSSIIESKKYNHLLEGLLENPYRVYDYSKPLPFKKVAANDFNESQLTYINDLNYSQEKVISLLDEEDRLVIWGPPGTGKSQTITSLIAKQVAKGENVLVVSEKKAALDVIKSRLGYASKFALFMDDAQDKNTFYEQVKQFIDPLPPVRNHNNDRVSLDENIEKILGKLERMVEAFYQVDEIDVAPHLVYERYLTEKKIDENLFPETVYNTFLERFKTLNYKTLYTIETRFNKTKKLRIVLQYLTLVKQYPLLTKMQTQLSRSEKTHKRKFEETLEAFIDAYHKAFFFRKRKLRKRFIKAHYKKIEMLFDKPRYAKRFIQYLLEDENLFEIIRKKFNDFERAKYHLENSKAYEHTYLEMLIEDAPFTTIDKVHLKHTAIFDSFYTGYIEVFEAKNQDKLYDMNHYQSLIDKLKTLMETKRNVAVEDLSMQLYKDALNLSDSKRIMDIKQRLESQRKWSVSKFIHTFQLELLSNVKVWMLTPEVVSEIIPLNFAMFDLVVFDEASQMFVEKAIPTIYRAKKVVIAGDTKQLRPSSLGIGRIAQDEDLEDDTDIDITIDAESLLDLARYRYKETLLNYHYRAKYEELIAFSNHAFYDGKLLVSPNQVNPKKPPIEYFVCEDGLWENRKNHAEALKVIEILKKVLRQKDQSETVGIITFNAQQRDLIEDMLDEVIFASGVHSKRIEKELNRLEDGEDRSIFIKNIENVQGDERDIIIFSTAYAKNQEGRFLRQFGWLNNAGGENRLNVAISRAKKKIFLVTSFYPNQLHVEDLKSRGPKLLKKYLEYGYNISKKDSSGAARVLESLHEMDLTFENVQLNTMQNSVFERLQKEPWDIQSNIGIGAYKIDFGVKFETDKDYKVAILCDIKSSESVPRDFVFHQEKFLEARGWQVYRIFAPSWYKDSNAVMRDLRKFVKAI